MPKLKKKGQILLEILWLLLFACAFLMMVSHLYDSGSKEIQKSRLNSLK